MRWIAPRVTFAQQEDASALSEECAVVAAVRSKRPYAAGLIRASLNMLTIRKAPAHLDFWRPDIDTSVRLRNNDRGNTLSYLRPWTVALNEGSIPVKDLKRR